MQCAIVKIVFQLCACVVYAQQTGLRRIEARMWVHAQCGRFSLLSFNSFVEWFQSNGEPKATNIHLLTKPKSKQQYCSCSFFSKWSYFSVRYSKSHENMNKIGARTAICYICLFCAFGFFFTLPLPRAFFLFSVDWFRNGSSENKQNAHYGRANLNKWLCLLFAFSLARSVSVSLSLSAQKLPNFALSEWFVWLVLGHTQKHTRFGKHPCCPSGHINAS